MSQTKAQKNLRQKQTCEQIQVLALQQGYRIFAKVKQLINRQSNAGQSKNDHRCSGGYAYIGARESQFLLVSVGQLCRLRFFFALIYHVGLLAIR